MVNILVVDDEPMICKGVATILKQSKLDINEVFKHCHFVADVEKADKQ